MVMSTRRRASFATTCTPEAGAAMSEVELNIMAAAKIPSTAMLRIHLASHHHLLRLVVEGHFLAGLNRSHIHAESDGMAVSCFDRRIGRLARAHAFHPVAHVRGGLRIGACVGRCRCGLCMFDEREARQQ